MFKNYLKIAWRSLMKNKLSSFINIGGAVGMTVAMLIVLWICDELLYNKSFANYRSIAQVTQRQTSNGVVFKANSAPFPLGTELHTVYGTNFKYVVMASWKGDHILTACDKVISKNGIFMDVDAPRMFTLEIVKGTYDCFKERNSVLLSTSMPKAIFRNIDPIDEVIKSWPIASSIALYFLQNWLQKYSYRTNIGAGMFILSAAIAIVITLVSLSSHAIKATTANAIKSMRTE